MPNGVKRTQAKGREAWQAKASALFPTTADFRWWLALVENSVGTDEIGVGYTHWAGKTPVEIYVGARLNMRVTWNGGAVLYIDALKNRNLRTHPWMHVWWVAAHETRKVHDTVFTLKDTRAILDIVDSTA